MKKAIPLCLLCGLVLLTACENSDRQPEPTDVIPDETYNAVTEATEITAVLSSPPGGETDTAQQEEIPDMPVYVRTDGVNTGYLTEDFLFWQHGARFVFDDSFTGNMPENADCIIYMDGSLYYDTNNSYVIIPGFGVKNIEVVHDYSDEDTEPTDGTEKIGEA